MPSTTWCQIRLPLDRGIWRRIPRTASSSDFGYDKYRPGLCWCACDNLLKRLAEQLVKAETLFNSEESRTEKVIVKWENMALPTYCHCGTSQCWNQLFNRIAGRRISNAKDVELWHDRIYATGEWLNRSFSMIDTICLVKKGLQIGQYVAHDSINP